MAISTAMAVSFKTELLQGAHNFTATVAATGSTASGSTSVTSVSTLAGVLVGDAVTGTGVNAVVVAMPTTSSLTLSAAATTTSGSNSLSFAPDTMKLALIKASPSGSYGSTTTNYSNLGADEVTGTGYSLFTLTNITPLNDGSSIAYTSFNVNPSWSGATFSTDGCLIYNSSARLGGVTGRAVSVHNFGGTQSVSSGTLTILLPSNAAGTALLRLS